MKTLQNYTPATTVATPVELTAPTSLRILTQLETLQNVVLVMQNTTFRHYYGRTVRYGERQLEQALSELLAGIDPLLLEALAAYDIQDIQA